MKLRQKRRDGKPEGFLAEAVLFNLSMVSHTCNSILLGRLRQENNLEFKGSL